MSGSPEKKIPESAKSAWFCSCSMLIAGAGGGGGGQIFLAIIHSFSSIPIPENDGVGTQTGIKSVRHIY